MFQVKRIDKIDDNGIYTVYSVHSKHGFIFFLINVEGNLVWRDSRQFIPIDKKDWSHYFIEKGTRHAFYAIESIELGNTSIHYLIYYCSKCNKWHRIEKSECMIEENISG